MNNFVPAPIVFLCAMLSIAPFLFSPIPMMPDLFNHIARYHLMYDTNSQIGKSTYYYSVRWALIGNLGMDLLSYPLIKMFGLFKGSIIATAVIPPLTVLSMALLSRAVWGRIVPSVLICMPFVYSFTFLFGFTNYHLSVAMAFIVAAAWIRLTGISPFFRWLIFVPLACAVWLAHIGGWMVLVVLVGCKELVLAWNKKHSLNASIINSSIASLPVIIPITLIVLWRVVNHEENFASKIVYDVGLKPFGVAYALASENRLFDVSCVSLFIVVAIYLVLYRKKECDAGLLVSALALAILYILLPTGLFNSWYADTRIVSVLFIVLFMSFAPSSVTVQTVMATLGVVIFITRLGLTSMGWMHRGEHALADLAVLDLIPEGSRVAAFGMPSWQNLFPLSGMDELPSLEIVRRNAFVNTEWDQPGAQIMKPVYNEGLGFNDSRSTIAGRGGMTSAEFLNKLPRNRFDYVWSYLPEAINAPWLKLVAVAPDGRLYKIDNIQ